MGVRVPPRSVLTIFGYVLHRPSLGHALLSVGKRSWLQYAKMLSGKMQYLVGMRNPSTVVEVLLTGDDPVNRVIRLWRKTEQVVFGGMVLELCSPKCQSEQR